MSLTREEREEAQRLLDDLAAVAIGNNRGRTMACAFAIAARERLESLLDRAHGLHGLGAPGAVSAALAGLGQLQADQLDSATQRASG